MATQRPSEVAPLEPREEPNAISNIVRTLNSRLFQTELYTHDRLGLVYLPLGNMLDLEQSIDRTIRFCQEPPGDIRDHCRTLNDTLREYARWRLTGRAPPNAADRVRELLALYVGARLDFAIRAVYEMLLEADVRTLATCRDVGDVFGESLRDFAQEQEERGTRAGHLLIYLLIGGCRQARSNFTDVHKPGYLSRWPFGEADLDMATLMYEKPAPELIRDDLLRGFIFKMRTQHFDPGPQTRSDGAQSREPWFQSLFFALKAQWRSQSSRKAALTAMDGAYFIAILVVLGLLAYVAYLEVLS